MGKLPGERAQTEGGRTCATTGEKEGRATAAVSRAEERAGGNPGKVHGKSEEANIYDNRARQVLPLSKKTSEKILSRSFCRDLTSALVTSEILFERQKQQEFMEKLKQHEKDENQKYLEIQQQKAEEEMVAEAEKAKKRFEKQMEHSEKLKQNIEEKAKHEKAMRVERAKKEALDNIEAVKEMEKLEKLQTDEKIRRKKELFEDKKKYLQKDREIKQQKIKEEKELDEVIEIYKEAKHRIDCMKQERVQEMRDAVLKKQEKIAAMVMAEQMDKSEAEEKIIKKAMAEKEAA
ncbi:hypothetical protein YQE_12228, partial [Dendroctonus ponderosae]